MKDEQHIIIQGWMINKLKLRGNQLLIYAIIYGFVQDLNTEFICEADYFYKTLNISESTSLKSIRSLIRKKYISENNDKTNNNHLRTYKIYKL